jgi:O-antigen ligase
MNLQSTLRTSAGVAAVALLAAAWTMLAYAAGPPMALAALVSAGVVVAVMWQPMVGVYLGLLSIPLELLSFRVGGSFGLSPSELLFLLTAAATAFHVAARSRTITPSPVFGWFLALLLVGLLGLTFAEDTFVIVRIVLMWSAFLAVAALVSSGTPEELERVLRAVGLTGGIVGLIALATTGDQQLMAGGVIASNRAEATFAHPNVLAFCLQMSIPVALVTGMRARGLMKVVLLAAAAIAVAGLALTLSRGGIVGAGISLAVLLAWAPFRRYAGAILLVLSLFALANLGSLHDSSASLVAQRLGTLNSEGIRDNPRTKIWRATPDIIADYPFLGTGIGNFGEVSPRYGIRDLGGFAYDHAHNIVLTFAAETGLIGVFLFLGFVFAVARAGMRALRAGDWPGFAPALAVAASLVGLFVTSLGEYPPRTNVIMAMIMVLVGSLVAYERLASERSGRQTSL